MTMKVNHVSGSQYSSDKDILYIKFDVKDPEDNSTRTVDLAIYEEGLIEMTVGKTEYAIEEIGVKHPLKLVVAGDSNENYC